MAIGPAHTDAKMHRAEVHVEIVASGVARDPLPSSSSHASRTIRASRPATRSGPVPSSPAFVRLLPAETSGSITIHVGGATIDVRTGDGVAVAARAPDRSGREMDGFVHRRRRRRDPPGVSG